MLLYSLVEMSANRHGLIGQKDVPPKFFHTVKADDPLYVIHPTRGRARRLWDGCLRECGRWCLG